MWTLKGSPPNDPHVHYLHEYLSSPDRMTVDVCVALLNIDSFSVGELSTQCLGYVYLRSDIALSNDLSKDPTCIPGNGV